MTEPPESLSDVLLAPFRHFTDPSDRLSYVYMGTALLIAITVYIVSHAREGTLRPAGLVRWLFPRDVLFHPSCQTDFAYFFVIRLIRAAIYGSIIGLAVAEKGPAQFSTSRKPSSSRSTATLSSSRKLRNGS